MVARRTISDLMADARARLSRLQPADAYAAMRMDAALVDTRCAELRQRDGSIPGATWIPLSVLFWRIDPTSPSRLPDLAGDQHRQLILLCDHGYSSSLAAATLHEMGFDRATDVIGGFQAWAAAGLPVTDPA
ncbi:MAG: rhodanese-like domain-containing protein [Chloroflexota bacterium]